jgi:hypothetical protein
MHDTQKSIDITPSEIEQTNITSVSIEQANSIEQELIAQRAYEKWRERGCPIGDDQHDWYSAQAEIELEAEARLGMEPTGIERVAC